LFLDELPEFHHHVLDVLRQPMEDGTVTIARASMSLTFPARFMLAAAMNPCPCGFHGDDLRQCSCTPPLIQRYLSRISGPLLDRIDLHIQVPAVKYKELAQDGKSEESAAIRARILAARRLQLVLAELLHDILGQQHSIARCALVRIEDVNSESDPDQLRAVADIMSSRGIPFQISLIPIYKDPARRVEIYLSDRPRSVEALKYMVSRGGSIILHGVTHQLRGNTGDDFEFWDALSDQPSHDSSDTSVAQKLELGMEKCFRAGVFPITWETPHYAASMSYYESLGRFFSHAYDRRCQGGIQKAARI
jgi:hypothetical protein